MMTLNPAALDELKVLQEEGDFSLTIELIDVFLLSSKDRLQEIEKSVLAGSAENASKAAHNFKSGARTLGAEKLGAYCEELEKKPSADRARELAALIQTEYVAVAAELSQLRDNISK